MSKYSAVKVLICDMIHDMPIHLDKDCQIFMDPMRHSHDLWCEAILES